MENSFKVIRLTLYPFMAISFVIYVCLYLISPLYVAYKVALLIGLLFTFLLIYLEKPNFKKSINFIFNWKSLCLLIPVFFIILVFGFVLSPLIKHASVDGHEVLGLTALGDYYKHLYVLSAIKDNGLPPHHPFFPSANLSYYYGYYLIPAAVSSVFGLDLSKVFFAYLLFTTFIVLFLAVQLGSIIFRTWYQRLLSLILFIFGTGLDIVPTLIQAKSGNLTANHIEFWSQVLNLSNYLVNNLYTALLWVPQHTLPSLIILVTGLSIILEEKTRLAWLILTIWFCVISSTFVSVTLIIWLGLAFIFIKKSRPTLFVAGLISVCLLFPYLKELTGRTSILSFGFYMTPFKYLPFLPQWANYGLTFFTEYGLILLALPIFIFIYGKKYSFKTTLISLGILLPILIGLFVKSSGFNDFSMRSVLPSQMALPFLMAFTLGDIKKYTWKIYVFLLLLLSFIPSMTGFFYEIHFKLIDRGVIDWPTSELLINLRKTPISNLATISNEDWVFLIPSYGYQPVYSPRLFDSFGYLSESGTKLHFEYANIVNNLFIYPTLGQNLLGVSNSQQEKFLQLEKFFIDQEKLKFIISRSKGAKSGLNPWFQIFELLKIENKNFASNFRLINGFDISKALKSELIFVETNKTSKIFINNNTFDLSRGLWLIAGCNSYEQSHLRLEINNAYILFDINPTVDKNNCAGELYYQSKSEIIEISETSKFKELYKVPVSVTTHSF